MEKIKTKSGLEFPLLDIKGKVYLEVKYRVEWFNSEKADWTIEPEVESEEPGKWVRFKCTIKNPEGKIMRVARKSLKINTSKDYESCETGSIGRALALLGYGTTQSAQDLEEDDVVDAPAMKAEHKPFNIKLPNANQVDPLFVIPAGQFVGKTLVELMEEDANQGFKYAKARIKDFNENTPKFVREYLAMCRDEGVI